MSLTVIETAEVIARTAHAGQKRRDDVTPYINHVEAVVFRLEDESEAVRAAAWLHDVLEDTPMTPNDLLNAGIPSAVVDAVIILTKMRSEDYGDYLERVKTNEISKRVKIADMLHNLSDSPTTNQVLRYARGLLVLMEKP